jgi:hypothetical protein
MLGRMGIDRQSWGPVRKCAASLAIAAAILGLAPDGRSGAQTSGALLEKNRLRSLEFERQGLAEPFKGITTSGTPAAGLFPVRSTGVSTAPVRQAASAFLATLTPAQKARTAHDIDDPEWRKWMNQHFYVRQGVGFYEMTAAQKEAGLTLLRAGLSAQGLKLTRDIMKLNHTLGEISGDNFQEYGEWLYWITVMGTPSESEPWGWQLDGHHAIVNYFVLGDQVVMTPTFLGSEPVTASSGKYKGVSVLQAEQDDGLALVRSLAEPQRQKAVVRVSKDGNDNVSEAFKDNAVLDYAGLKASDMTPAQKEGLLALVGRYVGNMDDGHARVKMDEVRRHLDDTHFAWIGATEPASVYYYRIQSPVILIEFDHQRPANTRHLTADPSRPTRQHIHTVLRTPNGNDYGKDLLRQHYAAHRH